MGQGQSRQGQLRLAGRRLDAAFPRRLTRLEPERRSQARALPRLRARHHRRRRRPDRGDVHAGRRLPAQPPRRQAAPARHFGQQPPAFRVRCGHLRRTGLRRTDHRRVVRFPRPGQDPREHAGGGEWRDQRGPEGPEPDRGPGRGGPAGPRLHTRGDGAQPARRVRALGPAGQERAAARSPPALRAGGGPAAWATATADFAVCAPAKVDGSGCWAALRSEVKEEGRAKPARGT
jgi:hypothetical protein